jgi:urease accessory protein
MTRKAVGAALLLLVAFVGPVLAHPHHAGHEVVDGFAHPWFGLDHLLAMVGVGLLAARLGGRCVWLVPAAFLSAMLLGAAVSFGSVTSFGSASLAHAAWWGELGVMLSVAVFGLLLARKRPITITGCLALVAGFALFHGYAHAAEAVGASPAMYLAGMITGTATLHAVGLAAGLAVQRMASERYLRLSGKAIATLGLVLLLGQVV